MTVSIQRCVYCHSPYRPDPRVGASQKSCSNPACRRQRKQEAQEKFLKENPGYFRGRYGQIKQWLATHPGYLANDRATHPEHMAKKRLQDRLRRWRIKSTCADIQVTMLRRKVRALRGLQGADIQDTIRLRLDGLLDVLGRDSCADIQVKNEIFAPTL